MLAWQCQHVVGSGLAAGPGATAAGIAGDTCSIWSYSVAVMALVPVTSAPVRTSVSSVSAWSASGAETSVAPG